MNERIIPDYGSLLAGKTAFITTAARGIGRSIARLFARQGATVYFAGRNPAYVKQTEAELRQLRPGCRGYVCDLAQAGEEGGIPISAVTGAGIEELKAEIRRRVAQETREGEWLIPYDRGAVLARLHDAGKVLEQSYEEDGVRVRAVLPLADYERLKASLEGADA